MARRLNHGSASREFHRANESVGSTSTKEDINKLVVMGVLPDRQTEGWTPAAGSKYTVPDTADLVVFEDYFIREFGVPVHPFVRKILDYYEISLCNLGPNSILHLSIFIHFCEGYLGIKPHFNLFRHLFCLRKRGGPGSQVCGGVYLQLRDGMKDRYIVVPFNTSVKDWQRKWFIIRQESKPYLCSDVDCVPVQKRSWTDTPSSSEMMQVNELMELIDCRRLDGMIVASNFLFRRVQPCKDRIQPSYEWRGDQDPTREVPDAWTSYSRPGVGEHPGSSRKFITLAIHRPR
jgi:hypothetical protein